MKDKKLCLDNLIGKTAKDSANYIKIEIVYQNDEDIDKLDLTKVIFQDYDFTMSDCGRKISKKQYRIFSFYKVDKGDKVFKFTSSAAGDKDDFKYNLSIKIQKPRGDTLLVYSGARTALNAGFNDRLDTTFKILIYDKEDPANTAIANK